MVLGSLFPWFYLVNQLAFGLAGCSKLRGAVVFRSALRLALPTFCFTYTQFLLLWVLGSSFPHTAFSPGHSLSSSPGCLPSSQLASPGETALGASRQEGSWDSSLLGLSWINRNMISRI